MSPQGWVPAAVELRPSFITAWLAPTGSGRAGSYSLSSAGIFLLGSKSLCPPARDSGNPARLKVNAKHLSGYIPAGTWARDTGHRNGKAGDLRHQRGEAPGAHYSVGRRRITGQAWGTLRARAAGTGLWSQTEELEGERGSGAIQAADDTNPHRR